MVKKYTLIAFLIFAVLSGLIYVYKVIDKNQRIEWAVNRERLIDECRTRVDEALSSEWEENCKLHSFTDNCALPINFMRTIKDDRIRQYKICTETYK